MSKYQRWYDDLIDRAGRREMPTCYTELHHIVPRSLGGHDGPINLVRLTYREHFIAHWLLTKFKVGGELRKMQRALFAMTLSVSGRPIATGWQFEAAKRAIRDLELDPEAERLFHERWRAARHLRVEQIKARLEHKRRDRQVSAHATAERLLNSPHLDRVHLAKLAMSLVIANPIEGHSTARKPKKARHRHRKHSGS